MCVQFELGEKISSNILEKKKEVQDNNWGKDIED